MVIDEVIVKLRVADTTNVTDMIELTINVIIIIMVMVMVMVIARVIVAIAREY